MAAVRSLDSTLDVSRDAPPRVGRRGDGIRRAIRLHSPQRTERAGPVSHRPDPALETFELLDRYRRFMVANSRAERTIHAYLTYLIRLMLMTMRPLGETTEDDITRFLESFGDHGATKGTALRSFRTFFRWAAKHGYIPVDPAVEFSIKRPKYGPVETLTTDELNRWAFAAAFRNEAAGWLVVLYYSTGARASEITGVKPDEVHLDDEAGPWMNLVKTKTGIPRAIPLNRNALQAVRFFLDHERPFQQAANYDTLVGISYSGVWENLRTAAIRAGLPTRKTRIHILRHTFATDLVVKGTDIRVVQELLGHSDLAMTSRYTFVSDRRKREAVDLLAPEEDES